MKNKYGLSRNITAEVKRQVRKACGFGCVICGASIIEYEHVNPPFFEAREHDPNKITLLCPRHHSLSTRGFLSKETILRAMKEPFCNKVGFAHEEMDICKIHPKIIFGGVIFRKTRVPIEVSGIALFEVKEPEERDAPIRVSAIFHNSRGELSLLIVDNEWRAYNLNWDVEVIGGVITIRDNSKHISLSLFVNPPYEIIIRKLDMYFMGYRFIGNLDEILVEFPDGNKTSFTGILIDNFKVGFSLP